MGKGSTASRKIAQTFTVVLEIIGEILSNMLRAFGNHLVGLGIKGFVALFVNILVRPLIELTD